MTDDHLRAADADRERIAERLRLAVDEGRLSILEYDERLRQLYSAKTYGELAPILADLPARADNSKTVAKQPFHVPKWVVIMWLPWAAVNVMCLFIWLATGAGYFWPFWVAVPWGCALLIPTAVGVMNHRTDDDEPRAIEQ
ncbi:MAG: DUF1707 domain-containing protein [Nocardiaceae bacterium]|nr:DUF1707 domain-containing protein [Nocardiaceae bacterium]